MRLLWGLAPLVQEVMNDLQAEIMGREVSWNVDSLPEVSGDAAMVRAMIELGHSFGLKVEASHRNTSQPEPFPEKRDTLVSGGLLRSFSGTIRALCSRYLVIVLRKPRKSPSSREEAPSATTPECMVRSETDEHRNARDH